MPIEYQQTTDREIHERVRRRHQAAMQELRKLGFAEHSFFGETVHAFGFDPLGCSGFLGMLVALFKEVTRIERNLDVTLFNVLMSSREYATYAGPFGLGVKFYTLFTDGTLLISANFDTPAIRDETAKFYKAARSESIASTWLNHKKRVESLVAEGKQSIEHLSFAGFCQLAAREDAYLMNMQKQGWDFPSSL